MPTYEYQCRSCAQRFEARQSIMASPRTRCPHQGTPSWECPLERWHSPKGGGITWTGFVKLSAADPLFHLCPDGHEGQVDLRYWDIHPLNLSGRHSSEGGGICVVAPETVGCCQRGAHWTDAPVVEG